MNAIHQLTIVICWVAAILALNETMALGQLNDTECPLGYRHTTQQECEVSSYRTRLLKWSDSSSLSQAWIAASKSDHSSPPIFLQ